MSDPIRTLTYGSLGKRLRAHVKIDKLTGCHQWTAKLNPGGYGVISVGQASRAAHRTAWELANGAIPEGMVVMHTCDNRRCCNPEHLALGTNADNSRDRIKKGRGKGARAADLEKHPQWGTPSGRPPRRTPLSPLRTATKATEPANPRAKAGWRRAAAQLLRPIIRGLRKPWPGAETAPQAEGRRHAGS